MSFNNIHQLEGGWGPPSESYTYMGDGRATVQRDTLVSIGNRCRNTFHLHLTYRGRDEVEMKVFFLKLGDGW